MNTATLYSSSALPNNSTKQLLFRSELNNVNLRHCWLFLCQPDNIGSFSSALRSVREFISVQSLLFLEENLLHIKNAQTQDKTM